VLFVVVFFFFFFLVAPYVEASSVLIFFFSPNIFFLLWSSVLVVSVPFFPSFLTCAPYDGSLGLLALFFNVTRPLFERGSSPLLVFVFFKPFRPSLTVVPIVLFYKTRLSSASTPPNF